MPGLWYRKPNKFSGSKANLIGIVIEEIMFFTVLKRYKYSGHRIKKDVNKAAQIVMSAHSITATRICSHKITHYICG